MSENNESREHELVDAVVLLHAFPFDREMWSPAIPVLSRTHRVAALDLAGFGASGSAPLSTIRGHADNVRERLAQQGIEKAHLVGCSLGGYVALAFAEQWPERVLSLTLVDSRTSADSEAARATRTAQIEAIRGNGTTSYLQTLIPKLFASSVAKNTHDHWLSRAQLVSLDALTTTLAAMRDRESTHDTWRSLSESGVPVHVVTGELDGVIPVEEAETLARDAGTTCDTIEHAGHLPPIEQPEAFVAILALRLCTLRVRQLEARAAMHARLPREAIERLLADADVVRNALLLRNAELFAAESRDDAPEFVDTTEQNQLLIKRCTIVVSDLRDALGLVSRANG